MPKKNLMFVIAGKYGILLLLRISKPDLAMIVFSFASRVANIKPCYQLQG